ncbi:MAG: Fimbrial assembly family protein [Pelosinus sp.]|jgi:type IV pilus assembly protein PilN|nr:Fimbrial assembly family protein [Pelosinus sp.]
MNTINLLPLIERQSKWPINKLLCIVSILAILVYSSAYSYNVFRIWNIEKELQSTRNQYELLQPTLKVMQTSNQKQQLLDKKNTIIAFLTNEHKSWYSTIQHLVTITPQQLWFTDLSKSDKGILQIKGLTTTYPVVAEFMKNMEQDPFFIEPILNKVESDNNTSLLKFEILVKPKGMQ